MIAELTIATFNRSKGGEMVQILSELLPTVALFTLRDFESAVEPEETGHTYQENAWIKASSAVSVTNTACLADDAGLEIDALDGAPGLYSKRFGGEELPFPEKIAKILDLLADVKEPARTARFRCCVALAIPGNPECIAFEASCEGRIASQPSGAGGFGYDPIFFLPELGCTMADLTATQKHQISHRGKVLRAFADYVRSQ